MENTENKVMENDVYTIVDQNADVITSSGNKRKYTIISREKFKYSAVTIVHGNIWSEFEVFPLTGSYNTYIEKLVNNDKPCIQWDDDFIYPQGNEWWLPNYTLKVFTEYNWGGGYWKEYTLQEYLKKRSLYGDRDSIYEFAEFLNKLTNLMVYLK
jgi:hypothetical protein